MKEFTDRKETRKMFWIALLLLLIIYGSFALLGVLLTILSYGSPLFFLGASILNILYVVKRIGHRREIRRKAHYAAAGNVVGWEKFLGEFKPTTKLSIAFWTTLAINVGLILFCVPFDLRNGFAEVKALAWIDLGPRYPLLSSHVGLVVVLFTYLFFDVTWEGEEENSWQSVGARYENQAIEPSAVSTHDSDNWRITWWEMAGTVLMGTCAAMAFPLVPFLHFRSPLLLLISAPFGILGGWLTYKFLTIDTLESREIEAKKHRKEF